MRALAYVVVGTTSILTLASCSSGGGSPSPIGAEAAETAATMSQLSTEGVGQMLDFEVPTGIETASTEASHPEGFLGRMGVLDLIRRHIPDAGSARTLTQQIPCGVNGSLTLTCDATAEGSTAEFSSQGCVEDLFQDGFFDDDEIFGDEISAFLLTVTGGLEMVTDDPDGCENDFENAQAIDTTFNRYTVVARVNGEVLARVFMDGSYSSNGEPELDCNEPDGSFGGSFTLQITAPLEGVQSSLVATDFSAVVDNTAAPCRSTLTLNGTLSVNDSVTKENITQTYSDFQLIVEPQGDAIELTMSGTTSTACIGDVQFTTITPLLVPDDGECATAGVVDVTVLDTGETSRIYFNPDASVDIDHLVDDVIDATRASCTALHTPCS